MTILAYIQLSTEVICTITSVVLFKQLRAHHWLPWIPFLLYTCVVELWGAYIIEKNDGNNLWLYNPYIIVCNAFYSWFLLHISILNEPTKRKLYYFVFAVSAGCLLWYLVWGDRQKMVGYFLNPGALTICVLCLVFFFTQIRHPSQYHSLVKVPGFWIASGLLVFYAGIFLYTAVYNFLAAAKIKLWDVKVQNLIPQFLSLFLYTAITIAFIYAANTSTKRGHTGLPD